MNQEATAWDFVRRAGNHRLRRAAAPVSTSMIPDEPYLAVAQASARFGLPPEALLSLAKSGKIRHLCIGRSRERYFRDSQVKADLQALELASLAH